MGTDLESVRALLQLSQRSSGPKLEQLSHTQTKSLGPSVAPSFSFFIKEVQQTEWHAHRDFNELGRLIFSVLLLFQTLTPPTRNKYCLR